MASVDSEAVTLVNLAVRERMRQFLEQVVFNRWVAYLKARPVDVVAGERKRECWTIVLLSHREFQFTCWAALVGGKCLRVVRRITRIPCCALPFLVCALPECCI